MKKRILLVDDEPGIRAALKMVLEPAFETIAVTSAREGLQALRRESPSLVLLDIVMPGEDGLELLDTIRAEQPDVPVIMLSALNALKTAVEAMKRGAADYLTKPFDADELRLKVSKALSARELEREVRYLRAQAVNRYALHGLVGKSPAMQEVYAKIEQAADTRTTVLITGESGTGKELVARALHYNSSRRDRPLIALNCAAIPEPLIESELFGHEKGAFTGADSRRIGHFELAHGGSLFLDEITELNTATQAKLLRVLQQREFLRVGGTQPVKVDVRILAATNKDLTAMLRRGELREDIYYRLNVVSIHLPPLRERPDDIPFLAQHFLARLAESERRTAREFSREALEMLLRHHWPGNVRELENVVEQVSIWCTEPIIRPEHLPIFSLPERRTAPVVEAPGEAELSLEAAVVELERRKILDALRRTDFVQTQAAALLGISRRMLKYRMDLLGIGPGDPAAGRSQGQPGLMQ
jgi:two-component system response regulator AtoC